MKIDEDYISGVSNRFFHGDARVGRRVWDKEAENGEGRSGSVNPVVGKQEETLVEGLTSSQGTS